MALGGTDPKSYITEYASVYEETNVGGLAPLTAAVPRMIKKSSPRNMWYSCRSSLSGGHPGDNPGKKNGFFSQLPFKYYLPEVAPVGD